jgi:ribonuclease R
MHARGFGFVQIENAPQSADDIFIPKHFTKNAVDGDRVEVLINHDSISEKGPEGKILTIISRARSHMAGIIKQVDRDQNFVVHVPLLGQQQRVILHPSSKHPLKVGDRVVMEVVDWGSKETETHCLFSQYLGSIHDPSCDISAAIQEYELRSEFPPQVIEEAEKLGKTIPLKEIRNRENLRQLTAITIDPDTAKDFDDAVSLTKDENGHYHLGVHIADVSHYVRPGTALDEEASLRCNSTYFPGNCIPMLPGALSENLCSLKPNVNRLTVSVLLHIDSQGNVVDHRMSRSVIKSAKRFTYKEAKKVLDGQKASPHEGLLKLMVELCQLLKRKRYERGSIEFSLPELVVLVDDLGKPYETDYITYDITHQMIEEFMLKANEMVAWDLTQKGKNLTYRIHDVPAEENLRDFSLLAAAFGFRISDNPNPQDLQKLFEEADKTPYANYLASSYIRRMRLAAYSPENIGHYGLSLTHYCHFTSPIRRYVDLVVHRILFGESDDFESLQHIATHCSDQERVSAKAETSVVTLKKLRLLQEMYQKDPYKEYEAIITRVKNFGVYFEIIDLLLEGFIHISDLGEDYFVFEEELMRLRGTRQGSAYAPGNRLTVMLREIDFIAQETKWDVIHNQQSALAPVHPKSSKKKIGKQSKNRFKESTAHSGKTKVKASKKSFQKPLKTQAKLSKHRKRKND